MLLRVPIAIFFAALGPCVPALTQEITGSVQGVVLDPNGNALHGATVILTGDGFPSGSSVVTNSRGQYRYLSVPPGNYTLRAHLDGFSDSEVPSFRVNLGAQLQLDIPMRLPVLNDVVFVVSDLPLMSITSSDTSALIADAWIEKMPHSRDFTSVVDQVAGANREDTLLGGISIDGSSGAENRFVVDGVDTTSLQKGTSKKRVLTDFVEEVQVKLGGYEAEFGGATGGVINAVTKQGGNDLSGNLYTYFEDSQWDGDVRPVLQTNPLTATPELKIFDDDDRQSTDLGLTVGGPLKTGLAWFFLGYSAATTDTTRTVDFLEPDITKSFNSTSETDYATFNVTGTYGKFLLRLGGNLDDQTIDNTSLPSRNGTGSSDPDDFNTDSDRPGLSWSGSLDYLHGATWAASLRIGHFEYDTRDTGFFTGVWAGLSTTSAGTICSQFPTECDPTFDPPLGTFASNPQNNGTVFDFFQRDTLGLDATFVLNDLLGDHELKVGFQLEELENHVLDGYSNTRILFYIDRARTNLEGESVRGTYGAYRVLQIATQTVDPVQSENSAIYIQDSWRATDRLTLNLGVRAEKETVPSFAAQPDIPSAAIQFDYGDKLAPRLGFAYDVKGDGRWKAYGSYGVFYDVMKLELPRGLFGGDKWVDYYYGLESLDINSIIDTCRIVENSPAVLPEGCPGEFLFLVDQRHPSNDPSDSNIDPNLEPLESNEITLGVEHLLGRHMTVGARFVHKELERTVEDVGINVPGVGTQFVIANPGEGTARDILGAGFPSQPRAVRDYDGLTLTFRTEFSNDWGLNASYTYSRLRGNYSGLSSSDELGRTSPNVNRFFDGLQNSFDQNGRPVRGRLGTDRPHQFKVQLLYALPWGTFLGLNQRVSSGTPISTEYDVTPGLPFFPFGRGDLGRTETFSQTDVNLFHRFSIGSDYGVEVSLNITNLFDDDAVLSVFNDGVAQDLPLSDEEFFAGFDSGQVIEENGIPKDSRFGLAERFQARRKIRLGIRFTF